MWQNLKPVFKQKTRMKYFLVLALMIGFFLHSQKAYSDYLINYRNRCYFHEDFSNKKLINNQIIDESGKIIWEINEAEEQKNSITDTGALELGNSKDMQQVVLKEKFWDKKQNYAMEFTINIQKMGNEGNYKRPVLIIIPRAKDINFKAYYAVTYFLEDTHNGSFRCKWGIVNTNAPTGMKPLVEGYYLLKENVNYTARIEIKNIYDKQLGVKILFYIDSPEKPAKEFKPLLEYADTSKYKIMGSVTGPAFGMKGYLEDGWGVSPVVRYDNIRLYDIQTFERYKMELEKHALINPTDIEQSDAYGEIKYLINSGILGGYSDNTFKPHKPVSVAEFLTMLVKLKEGIYEVSGHNWPKNYIEHALNLGIIQENEFNNYYINLTKYEAALLISRFVKEKPDYKWYWSCISDYGIIPSKYREAVCFSSFAGYLRLDDDLNFSGNNIINRAQAAKILLRLIDPDYRKINYSLQLPHILSSGAVFQRNKPIPIWGRGITGDTVTVIFKDQIKTTKVKNGNWYLELDPEPEGGPYQLVVKDKNSSIVLDDILIGEVFIIAGQSNAEMYLRECYDAEETKEKLRNNPLLRFYFSEQNLAATPRFKNKGDWNFAEEWVLSDSSAVGTFFIEKLLEINPDLNDIPIGLIHLTYGGRTIEVFIPYSVVIKDGFIQKDDAFIMSEYWNGFMQPVAPYSVKAVIYYQGENSTHLGEAYEGLLRKLIKGFREEFKNGKLPFLLVQISGYGESYEGVRDGWPVIREMQMKVAQTTDNVGIVTTIDLADKDRFEIHPKNKKPIGKRLAYLAMKMLYGKDLKAESQKPTFHIFKENKLIVGFNKLYGSVYIKDSTAKGFEVLNSDKKWHKANAVVNEKYNTVEIWNDEVPKIYGVRYAWRNYPEYCLFNEKGFPVFPFKFTKPLDPKPTTEYSLKITNHGLKDYDGIVNITRGNQFRMIKVYCSNSITHEYAIKGQSPGDKIKLLSSIPKSIADKGTTETILKIPNHGLSAGDWIRNNSRGWAPRRVEKVIDKDTIEVAAVPGQYEGDEIERYVFIKNVFAE